MGMAKIPLSEGFKLIPEGVHIFKIVKVTYKEDFGKLEVDMETAKGEKHKERFSLLTNDNTPNQGALNAFSYFAKTALNDFDRTEIDDQELVGHYIKCEVTHEKVPGKNGGTMTFARLGDKASADGFEGEVTEKPKFDLNSILG